MTSSVQMVASSPLQFKVPEVGQECWGSRVEMVSLKPVVVRPGPRDFLWSDGETDSGISFDTSFTWSNRVRDISGTDMYIERMALALIARSGAGCNTATGTPGAGGCEYYNPFSNALPFSAITGANPQYNAAVANSDALINYLTADTGSVSENESLVFEIILSGESGWALDGGNVSWAAGLQYRKILRLY
ncbi:MAG: hypothetical protein ACNYPE_08690 [Candidatus Azotimanducaceae bacterium WSBS_2022_MAG_OTU7]